MYRQIYIDPVYIKGNILRVYLLWDWNTRLDVRMEFPDRKIIRGDRFEIIAFMTEYLRRTGISLTMTREQFINIQLQDIKGLKVKVEKVHF